MATRSVSVNAECFSECRLIQSVSSGSANAKLSSQCRMTQSLPSDSVNGERFSQCKVSRSAPGDSVSAERVPGDSAGAEWLSECRVISQYRVIHSVPGDVVNAEHARQIWWAPANSSGRQQIIQRPSGVTGAIGWRAFEFTNAQCNCLGSNVCHQCNAPMRCLGSNVIGFHDRVCLSAGGRKIRARRGFNLGQSIKFLLNCSRSCDEDVMM